MHSFLSDITNPKTSMVADSRCIRELNELCINLSQLRRNYFLIRNVLQPNVKLMAILKGNAYGHGMIPIARELERCSCDAFGVVRLNEAVLLRKAGIQIPVMLLAPILPEQADTVVTYNITPMVDHYVIAKELDLSCQRQEKQIKIHIKVNTGLNRYGIEPEQLIDLMLQIAKDYNHITIEGIYTHFRNSDFSPEITESQIRCFDEIIHELEQRNMRPPIVHAANSAAIMKYPWAHYDMVRSGVMIFGLEHTEGEKPFPEGVTSIITLKGRVMKIRALKAGEAGGYGNGFLAYKDTVIAVVSLGYGDGISRGWKEILIAGKRVPIINYFMDGMIVDITDISDNVKVYDEVVIIGGQGKEYIGWGEACKALDTYEEEQVQYIADRVTKRYYYD